MLDQDIVGRDWALALEEIAKGRVGSIQTGEEVVGVLSNAGLLDRATYVVEQLEDPGWSDVHPIRGSTRQGRTTRYYVLIPESELRLPFTTKLTLNAAPEGSAFDFTKWDMRRETRFSRFPGNS